MQGGRLVGMDDVNAAVEEHKEQGRMGKWWSGVTNSKSGQAFGNHSAVKALTYVSLLSGTVYPDLCVTSAARKMASLETHRPMCINTTCRALESFPALS